MWTKIYYLDRHSNRREFLFNTEAIASIDIKKSEITIDKTYNKSEDKVKENKLTVFDIVINYKYNNNFINLNIDLENLKHLKQKLLEDD